ncbi:hypothetical protein OM076_37135 [Solirubrobacter ginsenosidimutans]|uniref:Phospholipase C n=1 Tax=Solirubrobacter ginsenosidimutans TaxID=490573 RepID=A0A9X3N016_9ACTN|nr:alkaline phosphatase family protein [Solirubrobacter ginsenosidimutans]MDA0165949.1 hypothetical protein [Solirubrobacter ginsenosidimutans]
MNSRALRRSLFGGAAGLVIAAGALAVASADSKVPPPANTPIEHVVVIFGENQSFDHYFGTYPVAENQHPGQPLWNGSIGKQTVDGLTPDLINNNPNSQKPRRLDRSEAVTCDFNHNYDAEQRAFNGGAMNRFPENTDTGNCSDKRIVMSYYDGNTVTAMWNYAQHFAMSDRHFGTTFGPSTIGAINLISGNTHGVSPVGAASGLTGTMIANSQPLFDDCAGSATASFSGKNIGNLMNTAGVTWGWFAGGFKPTSRNGAIAVCAGTHTNAAGAAVPDYLPHHAPFQYYLSTSNQHHLPPTGPIGTTDQANHLYDLTDFADALEAGNLPQVSFLKAVSAEDGHPGYSGPLDEQRFIVRVLNGLQSSPEWDSTAVFLAYDDSDGWYDHAHITPLQGSDIAADSLGGASKCGPQPVPAGDYRGRCGPGPRLPLLVVSPWAKQNFIDHKQTEQTSILKFIEDNWSLGRIGDQSFDERAPTLDEMFDFDPAHARAPKLILDERTGNPAGAPVVPTPSATATPVPTTSPAPTATATATATPKPSPTPAAAKVAVKLSCKTSGGGKRITVSCTGSGKDVTRKTTLRFEILANKKVVASAKGSLAKKKVKLVIKAKKTLKKGSYTLRISISQSGRTAVTQTKSFRLK